MQTDKKGEFSVISTPPGAVGVLGGLGPAGFDLPPFSETHPYYRISHCVYQRVLESRFPFSENPAIGPLQAVTAWRSGGAGRPRAGRLRPPSLP